MVSTQLCVVFSNSTIAFDPSLQGLGVAAPLSTQLKNVSQMGSFPQGSGLNTTRFIGNMVVILGWEPLKNQPQKHTDNIQWVFIVSLILSIWKQRLNLAARLYFLSDFGVQKHPNSSALGKVPIPYAMINTCDWTLRHDQGRPNLWTLISLILKNAEPCPWIHVWYIYLQLVDFNGTCR